MKKKAKFVLGSPYGLYPGSKDVSWLRMAILCLRAGNFAGGRGRDLVWKEFTSHLQDASNAKSPTRALTCDGENYFLAGLSNRVRVVNSRSSALKRLQS